MGGLIDRLLSAARRYSAWDFGWLKLTLISLGILFGVYFYQFFLAVISIVWVIFAVGLLWVFYKTFVKYLSR